MNSDEQYDRNQLVRELNYYRREYNDLGARVLRLQEEQSRAFREARRSRTVAKLAREAYRLVDRAAMPEEIGNFMLDVVVENAMCDRMAILRQLPGEGRVGEGRFVVTHALGFVSDPAPVSLTVPSPPDFFFTTAQTKLEPPAYELTEILRVPYILWSYDAGSGYAMIVGNQSEGNISRPFEAGDQELIEGALSVYIDIVYRKQAEIDLRAAKLEAEEAGASQARFLATLSHELRTPLNAIIGFSDMLKGSELESLSLSKWREYAQYINESGVYLLSLINDILDHSSLQREAVDLDEERVDLIDLLVKVVEGIKPMALQKNLKVAVDVAHRLPSVTADPRRIRQALTNLASNAVKFTPDGGNIAIRAGVSGAGALVIEVEDSGIGIAADDLSRVFEPFVQLDNIYQRAGAGTGLGLSISRSLVEAHGGELSIRSEPGKGTTATITLPPERLEEQETNPDRPV
jgi:signal transduction histidine kinase